MRMSVTTYLALVVLCFVSVSCYRTDFDPQVLESDAPALLVRGEPQFVWDPLTCQQRFVSERGEFCVGSDNMSDYFILTLTNIPTTVGEQVRGKLEWTTPTSLRRLSNMVFEVKKIDGEGVIWLWCPDEGACVTVRVL